MVTQQVVVLLSRVRTPMGTPYKKSASADFLYGVPRQIFLTEKDLVASEPATPLCYTTPTMTRHDRLTKAETPEEKNAAFYDNYDYNEFWNGREYESRADAIALVQFLKQAKVPGKCIIDVGGGLGRLVPHYVHLFETATLLDPSLMQLEATKERIGQQYPNLSFVRGIAEHIPVEDASIDSIVCVRVSHHIPEIRRAILEYKRALIPNGYLILDVANKLHFKARLQALFNKEKRMKLHGKNPVKVYGDEEEVPYVNHNPHAVIAMLKEEGFEIVATRSVSNLRSRLLKKILPLTVLVFIERLVQSPLGVFYFGPSIFVLARKK